jgi:glucokinase
VLLSNDPDHRAGGPLDPDEFVLAIDFGGTKVAFAAGTGDGEVVSATRYDFPPGASADEIVATAIEQAAALTARTLRSHPGGCVAVGVSSPGIVLPDRVLLAPNVPGWQDLALADRLATGLGLGPVVVGTDVKAAAAAELRWGSLAGHDQAIYLNLGTGIAAALVVNGSVVIGAHGAAGELAYNLVDPQGPWTGVRDGRAPLEEVVSGLAIGVRGAHLTGGQPSARSVFALAETDPRARRLIDSALRQLAGHVANLAIAIDPAVIAVGGGLMASADRILPVLAEALAAVPFPPVVVSARFRDDAALRGAVALALDQVARSRSLRGSLAPEAS